MEVERIFFACLSLTGRISQLLSLFLNFQQGGFKTFLEIQAFILRDYRERNKKLELNFLQMVINFEEGNLVMIHGSKVYKILFEENFVLVLQKYR
jgi:hypothetical protein